MTDRKNTFGAQQKEPAQEPDYTFTISKMGVIRNLEKNKDYYRLSQIMRPNRIATLIAFKQGKGFAVNKELFDIQMMLFRFEGNDEIADKLEEITPEYYMNSIISLDSK